METHWEKDGNFAHSNMVTQINIRRHKYSFTPDLLRASKSRLSLCWSSFAKVFVLPAAQARCKGVFPALSGRFNNVFHWSPMVASSSKQGCVKRCIHTRVRINQVFFKVQLLNGKRHWLHLPPPQIKVQGFSQLDPKPGENGPKYNEVNTFQPIF